MDKGKTVIKGEGPVDAEVIKKPPTKRSPPICQQCDVSGHIRHRCPQRQGQKKLSRHAPLGTRPPTRYQAPQHQRQQQRSVLVNQKWIPKKDTSRHYEETLQTPKRDLSYDRLPLFRSFMHSLLRYMEKQLEDNPPSPQERQDCDNKDDDTHPSGRNGPT
jgi:hypothetical protein